MALFQGLLLEGSGNHDLYNSKLVVKKANMIEAGLMMMQILPKQYWYATTTCLPAQTFLNEILE